MKYNTISTSNMGAEGKKSTLTIYADMDISRNKMAYTEAEMSAIRAELEIVQKTLKLQTKRCRQLVAEYTRRLQEKEQQYRDEKALRDDQLSKVLRALLIFEARLRQEQKYISHQLNEKDHIISKQTGDIRKLLLNQYCKSCSRQYYTSSPAQESLDDSSENAVLDGQDYQSSNFESLDSSSETYPIATKTENLYEIYDNEESSKSETELTKIPYQKNRNKDSLGRRSRKIPHRKSIGSYFEVLKLRNDSPMSDNTSNDYDNLDSLPPESITDQISIVSNNIEELFDQTQQERQSSPSASSENSNNENIKVVGEQDKEPICDEEIGEHLPKIDEMGEAKLSRISDTIPVFEGGEDTNETWYASASDQEDEEQRDVYRNNPVLECMNQILLQNMNDPLNSPPKTPHIERKSVKNKRVKFSDEEPMPEKSVLTEENLKEKQNSSGLDYYETPVQKTPNFYETPQSIYSNDYEQILSKCSETFSNSSTPKSQDNEAHSLKKSGHYYIDLENKRENEEMDNVILRKSKISRIPPALPPKPANLVSKYKIQNLPKRLSSDKSEDGSVEMEPDYCSISELNLPPTKNVAVKRISVVAEINAPTSQDVLSKMNSSGDCKSKSRLDRRLESQLGKPDDSLVVKKCVEKLNIQLAKQTPIKSEAAPNVSPKKMEPEIPKLPQVSEIIIPDEADESDKEEQISQDNYVKNNSQIFKLKTNHKEKGRKSILIGSSVSSLISGFNKQQLLSEIKKKPDKGINNKINVFSSFENLQNLDKQVFDKNETPPETHNFDNNFDLSQNFEEFKLDDCEIEEYSVEDDMKSETSVGNSSEESRSRSSSRVELVRATNDVTSSPVLNERSIELLKQQLDLQKSNIQRDQANLRLKGSEPTYEHFLECTGLSTKSILTPSRLLSNHKSMLKPKDVKLRSKVKANNNLYERNSTSSIKYWSEPYI